MLLSFVCERGEEGLATFELPQSLAITYVLFFFGIFVPLM